MSGYTFPITKDMACAKSSLSISRKHAEFVARSVNRKPFVKAKKILQDLVAEKVSLLKSGKFHTKSAKQILELVCACEANAKAKNLPYEKMRLYVSVSRGPSMYRLRTKQMYGKRLKICNVHAVIKGVVNVTRKKVRE